MADKVSLATLTLAKEYTDEHGGGGGGTSNYNDLTHKPTVNGVEFKGTMTGADLGLVNAETGKSLSTNDYTDADKAIVDGVTSALALKVDKVDGKSLSDNNYSNTDKAIVDGVTTALNGKVSKSETAGLLKNDGTVDTDKKANLSDIAPTFSTSVNYKAYQLVVYNGELYRFKKNHNAGAWISDDVQTAKVEDVLKTKQPKTWFDSTNFVIASSSTGDNETVTLNVANQVVSGVANVVTSGAVYTAVSAKEDRLNWDTAPTQNSNNPVTSGGVYTALQGKADNSAVIANTQLIADTVGWSGKNLYDLVATSKTDAYGGVWTVNDDKTITVSGTPTDYEAFSTRSYNIIPVGSYILSWDNANVVNAGLDTLRLFKGNTEVRRITIPSSVSPVPFNITAEDDYDEIRVAFKRITNNQPMSGTIKPMIRKATILDDTYEPNRNTTAFPRDEQAVLGAKNFLPNNAITTTTEQGITYTINDDKTVFVAGGQSTTTYTNLILGSAILPEGNYILSGCPSGGSANTYRLRLAVDSTLIGIDSGNGYSFHADGNTRYSFTIAFSASGTSYTIPNDLLFKPMLRLASDPDDTYVPYAMTNRELTESNRKLTELKTYVSPNIGARFYKIGRVCYVSFESAVSDKAYVDEDIMDTIPEEFRPIYSASFLDVLGTSHNRIIIYDTIRAKGSFAAGQNIRGCLTYITNN